MSMPAESLLRIRDVLALTGLGRSQLYALTAQGRFPRPVKLSVRCSAWPESEVRQWIADRIAASRSHKAAA